MTPAASSCSTPTPSERRMSAVMATSPTSGTWRMTLGPSPSTAATMCLVTAFFEPRMKTSPRRGPEGATDQALGGIMARVRRHPAPAPRRADGPDGGSRAGHPAGSGIGHGRRALDDARVRRRRPAPVPSRHGRSPRRRVARGIGDPIDLDGPKNPRQRHPVVPARPGLVVKQRGTPISGTVVGRGQRRAPGARPPRLRAPDDPAHRAASRSTARSSPWSSPAARPRAPPPARPPGPPRARWPSPAPRPRWPGPAGSWWRASTTPSWWRRCGATTCGSRAWWWSASTAPTTSTRWSASFGPEARPAPRHPARPPGRRARRRPAWPPAVDHPDVLVTGHPYVDIWQAVKPSVLGIAAWPEVPRGEDWKTGVLARLRRRRRTRPLLEAPAGQGHHLDRPRTAAHRRRRAAHRLRDRAGRPLGPAPAGPIPGRARHAAGSPVLSPPVRTLGT